MPQSASPDPRHVSVADHPGVERLQEAARIIDPDAFEPFTTDDLFHVSRRRQEALEKAIKIATLYRGNPFA